MQLPAEVIRLLIIKFKEVILPITLILGGWIASTIAKVFTRLLLKKFFGVDMWFERRRRKKGTISIKPSEAAAEAVKWYVFLFFSEWALRPYDGAVYSTIAKLLQYYPRLVLAIGVLLIGIYVGEYLKYRIFKDVKLLANLSYMISVLFFGVTALDVAQITTTPIFTALNVFLLSLLASFGIALGIGLGLAMKDELAPMIREFLRGMQE